LNSVQPALTHERAANAVVDNSSPLQIQLGGVHNDNEIYAPIKQKAVTVTGSTPL